MIEKKGYFELELSDIVKAFRTKNTPVNYSRNGYGRKLPTNIAIKCADGRTRRVYVCCFSNSGTAYIRYSGRPFVVVESALNDLFIRDGTQF